MEDRHKLSCTGYVTKYQLCLSLNSESTGDSSLSTLQSSVTYMKFKKIKCLLLKDFDILEVGTLPRKLLSRQVPGTCPSDSSTIAPAYHPFFLSGCWTEGHHIVTQGLGGQPTARQVLTWPLCLLPVLRPDETAQSMRSRWPGRDSQSQNWGLMCIASEAVAVLVEPCFPENPLGALLSTPSSTADGQDPEGAISMFFQTLALLPCLLFFLLSQKIILCQGPGKAIVSAPVIFFSKCQ